MSERTLRAILYPMLALAIIAAFAGGLGVVFMLLYGDPHAESATQEVPILVLGIALTVGVPAAAYLLERRVEGS